MTTNQQMLEELIRRAIDGGWLNGSQAVRKKVDFTDTEILVDLNFDKPSNSGVTHRYSLYLQFIYNHDFAKALFGEEEFGHDNALDPKPIVEWQWMLQQAVISDNPIKYMWESIPGN